MDEEQKFKDLTKKYFGFLVRGYGFVYDENKNQFDSNSMRVCIEQFERNLPVISIWLKSEPKFTCISLEWLLAEYINPKQMDKFLLDDYFQYYAKLFQEHSNLIINDLDSLLLKGLKRMLINWLKSEKASKANFLTHLTRENSKYYQYIRRKENTWDIRREL